MKVVWVHYGEMTLQQPQCFMHGTESVRFIHVIETLTVNNCERSDILIWVDGIIPRNCSCLWSTDDRPTPALNNLDPRYIIEFVSLLDVREPKCLCDLTNLRYFAHRRYEFLRRRSKMRYFRFTASPDRLAWAGSGSIILQPYVHLVFKSDSAQGMRTKTVQGLCDVCRIGQHH